ncbi:single-stranded-DNA-specific exonuclease RecJ [Planctobacterium marinum]|uniref:single-stranded-DNA-specific exonuclease RecJ n=1 Tax=Planctobacterium marinum TaxID=1631968 RepID=UPI001E4B90D3|nr:single-stranded-DNA-specific exonuclease RecJ [Planctobacterium marinum]MCC2605247.1 single-stranded-DNA-specific exonuclease RecJ [Planctobacterium marinum]
MLNITRRPIPDTLPLLQDWPEAMIRLFAARGVKQDKDLQYQASGLHHFKQLSGVDIATELLHQALITQQKIIIIGDFDADGATSSAVLLLGLPWFGFQQVDFLVPNRFDFGYGLSPEIVDVAAAQGAQLLLTVDNGISSIQGVKRANELGIPVIITDHHLPGEQLPEAAAIVNPNLKSCAFPSKNLAGVGVAFYLLVALRGYFEQQNLFAELGLNKPNLGTLLDLVALGTVADVVPLDSNNRILVHQGIQRIRAGQCRPGITALLELANRNQAGIVASDLAFAVAPRLNAAGRLDDMTVGIQCLLADNTASARRMALQLDQLNQERRSIEAEMQQEAQLILEQMQLTDEQLPEGIALYEPHWHQGIVGILAGRIKDKYFRPVIAFAQQDEQTLKGSGRSIPGLHFRDLLEELNNRYPGLILKFGGHAAAAGLSIQTEDFAQFNQVFNSLCQEWLSPEALTGEILTDGELSRQELSLEFAHLLRSAGPWGQAFPEPQFDGVFSLLEQRIVGEKHLKMQVKSADGCLLDAIAFNVETSKWPNGACKQVQLVYKLDVNEFRGRQSVQLLVDSLSAV